MSPKNLLRHKESAASLNELADGSFQTVINETDGFSSVEIRKVIICSGKIYYDLRSERRTRDIRDTAIIRLEQLYPFPQDDFQTSLVQYQNVKKIIWCQEEPKNQGAWYSTQHRIRRVLGEHFPEISLEYTGREASAAAATGYIGLHDNQQKHFIEEALSM